MQFFPLVASSNAATNPTTVPVPAPPFDASPGWLNRITAAQLQEAYDQLPAERKVIVDEMDAVRREQYLGNRYTVHHRAPTAAPATVDPELRAICDALSDELKPGPPLSDRILAYIDKNPQTPFAADLYFYIAQLHSGWMRTLLGEKGNHQKALQYFQKAHSLYGEKFSYNNECAWASMANMAGSGTEKQTHRDWLIKLAAGGGSDDVYLIRELQQTLDGRPIRLSEAEKSRIIEWAKKGIIADEIKFAR